MFSASNATFTGNAIALSLVVLHAAVACYAAIDISRRLLEGWQPTFVASYLFLSFAGVAVPYLPEHGKYAAVLGLWVGHDLGIDQGQSSRFWLTEERRSRRILGFLPILLLGAQFVTLASIIAPAVHIAWFGPVVVLTAIPVYLAADSLLRVFQQRTGGLVHPLPISMIVPIFIATIFTSGGIFISAIGIVDPVHRLPFLITTALASGLFSSVGIRRSQSLFIYASLLCLILAYAFLPALSPQLADHAKQSVSHILGITPIPLSLRGFCYLPLIGLFFLAERSWSRSYP